VLGSSWAVSVLAVLAVVGLEWPSTAIVVYWIAARTALMGALFSVCCLGSFIGLCRTERAALAVPVALFGAAALASYEQALVLPLAALLIVAGLRVHRKRLAASGLGILFALVLLYIIVRVAVMGLEASAYQLMQTKSSLIGPVRGLCDYVLSPWYLALMAWDRATLGGLYAAGDHLFWWAVAMPVAWVASYARGLRANPRLFGALWATKAVIFLPMAQLHLTEHYYYLPEVAACALAVALVWPRGIQQVTAQSPAKGL